MGETILGLGNVINITVTAGMRGLSDINTSALALITDEEPIPVGYGDHAIYLDAQGVARDFGTNSATARLAAMVFAQQQNVLTGGGYLVVIPRESNNPAQPATIITNGVDLSALPTKNAGLAIKLGNQVSTLNFPTIDTTSIASVQNSLNTIANPAGVTFTLIGDLTNAQVRLQTVGTGSTTTLSIMTVDPASGLTDIAGLFNIISGNAIGTDTGIESIKDAILRTMDSIRYFGIICTEIFANTQAVTLADLARTVQTMQKILFVGSSDSAVITDTFKQNTAAGLTHTRTLFYSGSNDEALDFAAGYASYGLSCNFSGSNTTFTMHLKDIAGLLPDDIDQTTLQNCKNNGVDVYVNFGIPKIFTSGANSFYDQVYNRLALQLRMQIALFNFLATTDTKIPQTEDGMNAMKGTARDIFMQFVTNGMIAPGEWNSANTIGDNPETHRRNIKDFGFYIWSQPIAQQTQTERETRKAPIIQAACKETGAIHSGDLLINVEA